MPYGNLIPSKNLVGTNPEGAGYSEAENQGLIDRTSPYYRNPDTVAVPVTQPTPPASPASVISTDQGKAILTPVIENHQNDIKQIAAVQATPAIDTSTAAKAAATVTGKQNGGVSADELGVLGGNITDYTYDTNAGLYMPKGTTSGTPADADEQSINTAFDAQKGLIDSSTQNVLDSIKNLYAQRNQAQSQANTNALESFKNFGVRTGAARYTTGAYKGMLSSVENAGLQRLTDIAAEESGKIAEAEQARQNKEYDLFVTKRNEVTELRKEKAATISKLQDAAIAENKKIRDNQIRSSRDNAIAGLVSQGVTDPNQILGYLNRDDKGNVTGDFTAKEIADTLKSIAPNDDLDKLSGATRDFFILKGHGQLPASITSLPEDQQMFAYLAQEKRASSTDSGNKITLTEAQSNGLPLSVVGMSEQDIVDSLQSSTVPHWFNEKLEKELLDQNTLLKGQHVTPETASKAWEEYRQASSTEGFKDKKSANYSKAQDYFATTYEGLTPEQVANLASQTETYVNGGLSYAKAVARVESEAKQ